MTKVIRNKEIKIRMTDAEHRRLLDRANGKPLASWLRDVGMGERELILPTIPKCDPNLLRQITAIGNNINQIARAMNNQGLDPSDKIKYLCELKQIKEHLDNHVG